MNSSLFAISGLVLGITSTFLLLILAIFGRTKVHRIWLLFNISVAWWGFGSFFIGMAGDALQVLSATKVAYIGVIFIPVFFYHFSCTFSSVNKQRKEIITFAYVQAVLFSLLSVSKSQIPYISIVEKIGNTSFYYIKSTGILYNISFLIWVLLIAFGFFETVNRFFKEPSGIKRKQLLYLFWGFLLGFSGGLTNFFPVYGINIIPFGNFTIPIYCFISTYAILRYKLLDIRIVITRLGVFFVVYSLVLGIPFGLMTLWKARLMGVLGENWFWAPMGSLLVLATAGPYIYIFFQKKAENKLLAEQKQYQETLRQASLGMNRIKELKKLLNLIVHIISKAVRIEHCGVYLLDAQANQYLLKASRMEKKANITEKINIEEPLIKYLEDVDTPIVYEELKQKAEDLKDEKLKKIVDLMSTLRSDLIVPNVVNNKLIGILNLGKKKSGKMYTPEDIVVFSILANQSALAIENAMFYEESGKDLAQRFQESRLRGLGQLSSGIAHQIHNRLNIISLGGAVLLDMWKDVSEDSSKEELKKSIERTKRDVEKMVNSAIRGEEIANAIKNYARANPKPQVILFDEILNSSMALVSSKHSDLKYKLVKDYQTTSPLWANYSTIQDVIFNNIDNSCDAMKLKKRQIAEKRLDVENYTPEIKITTSEFNSKIKIEIEDNGIGMTKDQLEKMFVPFYTTKGAQKGTGMGMNVAYQLLSANKGTIEIDSVYQCWTKVVITIPKATDEQIQNGDKKEEENGKAEDTIG